MIDLEERRAELLALRARLSDAAESVLIADEASGEINTGGGDQHLADHATELYGRELDDSLEENVEHVLQEIEDALQRIEEGTYGTCAVCGREIPEERLAAVPYATLCVEDKRARERG
jgi:DnaK suppressor protein